MERRHRKSLPSLWLLTDERVGDAALLEAAARLPRGAAGIIFRHYHTPPLARRSLFDRLHAIARRRRLIILLAGEARVAAAWGADGVHGQDVRRTARPLLRSRPVHDRAQAVLALRAGVDLVLLSPLYPTRSHPGGRTLGRVRFATIAHGLSMPVMALGGVSPKDRYALRVIGAAGWAAIDGLTAG